MGDTTGQWVPSVPIFDLNLRLYGFGKLQCMPACCAASPFATTAGAVDFRQGFRASKLRVGNSRVRVFHFTLVARHCVPVVCTVVQHTVLSTVVAAADAVRSLFPFE
jgi:hypothetical protein